MEVDEIKKEIRNFILETFLFGYEEGLQDNSSFQEDGIIDSTGIFELIDYMENKFVIKVEDDEIVPENLDTLEKISSFVFRKLNNNS